MNRATGLEREHAEQAHVRGALDFADVAHRRAAGLDRLHEVGPQLLDVLIIRLVQLRRFANHRLLRVHRIKRPAAQPADVQRTFLSIEIAAHALAFLGVVSRELPVLPRRGELLELKRRDLMIRRGYNVVASFENIPDPPSTLHTSPIAQVVVDDYLAGKVDHVFIAYTDFINIVSPMPIVKQLLPLKPLDFEGMAVAEYVKSVDLSGVSSRVYSYEPEPAALLNVIVPRFTDLQVYQSVLESLASEHSARMMAMQNATDNASVLIDELTLQRNKARQASITSEILDIVGGAEALKG